MNLNNVIKSALLHIVEQIDSGNSNITEDNANDIIESINRLTQVETKYSKYQACKYLNISRATFDNLVKKYNISPSRQQGFKEVFYTKE